MVFTVLGAVAELERSLIVERVKAGLRNAKASDSITSLRWLALILFDYAGHSVRSIARPLHQPASCYWDGVCSLRWLL